MNSNIVINFFKKEMRTFNVVIVVTLKKQRGCLQKGRGKFRIVHFEFYLVMQLQW